jgi:hypothetical protein
VKGRLIALTRAFLILCTIGGLIAIPGLLIHHTKPVLAQSGPVPCQVTGALTATGQSMTIDNRRTQCYQWRVAYSNFGFSAISVQLEEAPDNGGVPGTWAAFTGSSVVTDGTNPQTNTNAALIGVHSAAAWVRLNLVTATGSGTFYYQVWGANSTSNIASLGACGGTGATGPTGFNKEVVCAA